MAQGGDTIISTVRTYLKAISYIEEEYSNCVFSTGFAVLSPYDLFNSKFFSYLLQSEIFIDVVVRHSKGVSFPAITSLELGNFPISIPSIEEQQRIVAFLDLITTDIDRAISEQQRLIELLKEKRQAVISHAVTKGLDPTVPMKESGIEWLGEVPEHWGIGALTRLAERVVVGIAEAATHAYSDQGVPILRSTNIRAGKIIGELLYINAEFAGERDSKILRAGDLVTVRTGNAGVTAIVPQELDNCQCFTLLITTLNERGNSEFYCYYINSSYAQSYFHVEGWGTAQVNISVPILKTLPTPIPPYAEQKEIVSFINCESAKIDTLLAQAQEGILLLQERRSALISAAVTGKIDVRGWQAPASADSAPILEAAYG